MPDLTPDPATLDAGETMTADALAGGQLTPSATGGTPNDDGSPEPLLVRAGCDSLPAATRFRIADPFSTDPSKAPVPAGRGGFVTDVAATAANDSWAATTAGSLVRPTDFGAIAPQRPHLYRFRDTEPPAAPAGDDVEPRPLVFEADPPIFVELPPDAEPPVPPSTTVTQPGPVATRQVRLKPAIYDVRSKVVASKRRRYTLEIRFRVRRTVTIGVEALRGRKVVGSSGLKRVRAPRGKLTVRLDRRRWPSRIRFTSAAPATTAPTATPPKAPR